MARTLRVAIAVAMVAFAINAHAPVPMRRLRLQLAGGRLEGLLVFHLPAAAARVYGAAPDRAVALAPRALAGLKLEADGAPLQPKVREARSKVLPDGALEVVLLLEAGTVAHMLRIAVEEGPPLPIELVTHTGVRLRLIEGPGSAAQGGFSLRPRPGAPCLIAISGREPTGTPR